METMQMNTKAKAQGNGSRVVAPSVSSLHQGAAVGATAQNQAHNNGPSSSSKPPPASSVKVSGGKDDPDKSLDDLESTLDSYFTYIGAKITDVATAGTAPKDQVDPTGKNTCQVCGQANGSWFEMRKHMRTHSDFRPYKCNLCPRSFHDMYKLKRHLVVHTGLKPYQCHICDQRLSRAEHLRRHLLIHKETKPFKCNLCEFSARRTDSVKSHQRSKHQGEWVHVVTVRSIIDIVSDETTTNTNLTPSSGKKKKKKKKKNPAVSAASSLSSPAMSLNSCSSVNTTSAMSSTLAGSNSGGGGGGGGESSSSSKADSRPIPGIASLRGMAAPYAMPPGSHYGFTPQQQQQQQQPQPNTGVSPGSSSSSRVSDSSPSPVKVKTESSGSGVQSAGSALNGSPGAATSKYVGAGMVGHGAVTTAAASASSSSSSSSSGLISTSASVPGQPAALCPSLHPVMTMAVDPASQAAFNLQAAAGNYYPGLAGHQYHVGAPGQPPPGFNPYFSMKPVFPEAMPINHRHSHAAHGHGGRAGGSGGGGAAVPGGLSSNKHGNMSSSQSPVNMSYNAKMSSHTS